MNSIWFSFIFYCLLFVVAGIILFINFKKIKTWKRILFIIILIALVLVNVFTLMFSAINPRLETIRVKFIEEYRSIQITPFGLTYTFENNDTKYDLEIDPFTKRKVYPYGFIKNEEYIITFEKKTNIILAVSKVEN